MKAADIAKNMTVQTAAVAEACKDAETHNYIVDCLLDMFGGNYGEIGAEDTALNNEELESGEGRILARYKAKGKLTEDIYIIAYFSAAEPGNVDYNNTTALYCSEY